MKLGSPRRTIVSLLVGSSIAMLPTVGVAQGMTSPGPGLEQQRKQRRYVVQPKPDPHAVTEDVDRATEALLAQRRFDRAVRDARSPFGRHPDLDYDVSGAIQSRRLHRLPLQRPLR